jgi:hypothetical protein
MVLTHSRVVYFQDAEVSLYCRGLVDYAWDRRGSLECVCCRINAVLRIGQLVGESALYEEEARIHMVLRRLGRCARRALLPQPLSEPHDLIVEANCPFDSSTQVSEIVAAVHMERNMQGRIKHACIILIKQGIFQASDVEVPLMSIQSRHKT